MVSVVAIQSFASQAFERFFLEGRLSEGVGWSAAAKIAMRKLDNAGLRGRVEGFGVAAGQTPGGLEGETRWVSRINDQWRVVFRWTASGPAEVDIRDYH